MTEPITSDELAAMRACWAASTPGPWVYEPGDDTDKYLLVNFPNGCGATFAEVSCDDVWEGEDEDGKPIDGFTQQEAAARFIANAHQYVPRLLDEVERLQAQLRNVEARVEAYEALRWNIARHWVGMFVRCYDPLPRDKNLALNRIREAVRHCDDRLKAIEEADHADTDAE